MITSIAKADILTLLQRQLNNIFMLTEMEKDELENAYPTVLDKVEYCFGRTTNKYYTKELEGVKYIYFNPFHSCQYTIFLYFYSKEIFARFGDSMLSDKIYYLNKMLNNCDLFYQIELPSFWGCERPCGSIMGRAKYGEGFFFYQCCTVGGNHGHYPIIGNVPADSIVFGQSPNLIIKPAK